MHRYWYFKISFLSCQVSCLLFCFVVTLPTTLGLSCYACHDYIGSPSSCSNPSVINCESFYNSCLTVHATMEMFGMSFSTTWKNCSVSSMCDSNFFCNQLEDDPMLKSCSTNCCSGNLCNGQSGQGNTIIATNCDNKRNNNILLIIIIIYY